MVLPCGEASLDARFVYRSGLGIFIPARGVRLPYRVPPYFSVAERPGSGLQNRPGRLDSYH